MISIQYFATAQDIIDAYGSNIPSNVVCIAGNNDSILLNSGNNNPHTDKEEQDKTTVVDKIKNQNITVDPTEETIILRHDDEYTGLGTVTITGIQASRLMKYITENGEYHYTPEDGHYYTGIDIEINVQPELQNKEVEPSREEQVIGCDEGKYGLRSVTVKAVTAEIDPDIKAENIRKGVEILGVYGTFAPIVDNITITPTTSRQSFVAPEGVDGYDKVFVEAVTSSIDGNILPENIKEGVNILGVEGTLSEGAGDTPDYRYAKGTADRAGLREIGWTDEDILTYEQNIPPHYPWQNDQYKVSDENKALYLLDDPSPSSYKDNPNIEYVPKKNMDSYFSTANSFIYMSYIKGIPLYDTSNVTDMSNMFHNCDNLTYIPQLITTNVTNMDSMFHSCYNLTTIPRLDTSNVTNMNYMFYSCSSLTAIPQLDTSNVTDMTGMFNSCNKLIAIPQLNTSNVTNMYQMFSECINLTYIPLLDTSSVTNMQSMFSGCRNLRNIPQLDTSNVTNMATIFNDCANLTAIPHLDTSKVTNMSNMFSGCNNITSIPQLDTSNVTDMSYMISYCPYLTTIPQMDTSNVTNMSWMFNSCNKLITIPQLDTSNVTNMTGMFAYCDSLTTVEGIDFSGLTSSPILFGYSTSMPNLTRFIVNGKINTSISDEYSIKALTVIDYDSVKSILAAADRTDNTNAKELAFNRTMTDQNGELAALVTSCAAKGWTITGLTIE